MIRNLTDKDFHEEVRENDDPIIIMFSAVWCKPCKNMYPTFEEMSEQMGSDIRFAQMDVNESVQTTSELGIRSVPSFGLFVDGMVREIYSGSMNKSDLRLFINENV